MDDKELRQQLHELHMELRQIKTLDESERDLLQALAQDIQEVLGQEEDRQRRYSRLAERLRGTVAGLEASHAGAALLMRQVIDSLSYLGV